MSIGKSSIARAVRTAQQSEPEKRPVQAERPAICTMLAPAEIRLLPDDSRSAVPTEALLQSVRTVGILEPLLVAEANGTHYLLAGHQRLAAAQALGLTAVPAVLHAVPDAAAAQALAAQLRPFAQPNLHEAKFRAASSIRSDLPPYLL